MKPRRRTPKRKHRKTGHTTPEKKTQRVATALGIRYARL